MYNVVESLTLACCSSRSKALETADAEAMPEPPEEEEKTAHEENQDYPGGDPNQKTSP